MSDDRRATAGADTRIRQARGKERRDRIIAEAVDLFSARGFRGSGIAELAKRAGMTHPGLLYYFGSKERLLQEVVAERERVEVEVFYNSISDEATSMSALPDLARLIFETATLTRLYVVLASENLDPGEPLHDFFVDRYERARQAVAAGLRRDAARGTIDDGIDHAQIACEVVSMLMGLEMQWLMDPDRVDYLGIIDAYTASLLERLGARPVDD